MEIVEGILTSNQCGHIILLNHDLINCDYIKWRLKMFIGRRSEVDFLKSRYEKSNGQLIVIYGRRRIGKTELLREFCKDKPHVFYSCKECTDAEQLSSFSGRMLRNTQASKYINKFNDWEQAFKFVTELPQQGKKLIVIDEFPYMVHANSSIPSLIQNLWDELLIREDVMIILCGSAMSFIEKEILAEKNPMYGRATGILKMNQMDFGDAVKFFPDFDFKDKILAYSILGGIPHYLKQFDGNLSIEENIKSNILTRGSVLYNEVEFLMRQELRETSVYNTLITTIAMGNTKLNDIFQKTQIDRAKISVYLRNLMDLNILSREFPITDGIKSTANVQRGLYNIVDNFFSFWYRFIFPNLSELEAGDVDGVFEYSVKPFIDSYSSKAFENVCIQCLRKKNTKGDLPFRFRKIGRWWEKGCEIDIMAFGDREVSIIGECKWQSTKMGISDLEHLKSKIKRTGAAQPYYYLFSKSGFNSELINLAGNDEHLYLIGLTEIEKVFL
ncbi:MAG: ATP-binding protein [Bacteroidota bacterium]|nr:ATP-binding protein [Bacteroidota bacterium]